MELKTEFDTEKVYTFNHDEIFKVVTHEIIEKIKELIPDVKSNIHLSKSKESVSSEIKLRAGWQRGFDYEFGWNFNKRKVYVKTYPRTKFSDYITGICTAIFAILGLFYSYFLSKSEGLNLKAALIIIGALAITGAFVGMLLSNVLSFLVIKKYQREQNQNDAKLIFESCTPMLKKGIFESEHVKLKNE